MSNDEHKKKIPFNNITRIKKEFTKLNNGCLEKNNIYTKCDLENKKVYALIIGTPNTPYENGFFLFEINLPDNYPFSPPTFKFCTTDPRKIIRFNPNLYKDGKVCLSIINTWNGPAWSPCNTIGSILVSIQALVFVQYPLRNEPGFENVDILILNKYNDIIEYGVLNVGVLNILKKLPERFNMFETIIENYIKNKIDWYIEKCITLSKKHNKVFIKCNSYNMKIFVDYDKLVKKFTKIKNTFIKCKAIRKDGKKCTYKPKNNNDGYCGLHKKAQVAQVAQIAKITKNEIILV